MLETLHIRILELIEEQTKSKEYIQELSDRLLKSKKHNNHITRDLADAKCQVQRLTEINEELSATAEKKWQTTHTPSIPSCGVSAKINTFSLDTIFQNAKFNLRKPSAGALPTN